MSHNTNLSGVTKSDVQLHTKKRFRKKYKLLETADNIDPVDELVLHKNGQAKNNICTLYLILRFYCQQKKIIKIG